MTRGRGAGPAGPAGPALALVLVLALPVLAGCLGATEPLPLPERARLHPVPGWLLSQPRFGALPGESLFYESHDGTVLHLALFRPDAPAEWKAPVVLVMSPYHGSDARVDPLDPASRPRGLTNGWLLDTLVPRGLAVAFADVRGTGESGGCLGQSGWQQAMDGYVTVEWLAAQPWSSGKVGMYGISYLGEAQQATAIHAPPSLVTIVPAASVDDGYKWWFMGGVPYWDPWLSGATGYMIGDGLQAPTSPQGLRSYPQRPWCHPEMAQQATGDGTHDAFWDDLDLRPGVGNIRASVLYVHGLQDWNVKPDHVHDWFNLIPSEKHAFLGQWAHNYPWYNSFRSDWSRADWNATVVRWFDHWLLGLENGVRDLPVVQVQDSAGAWRAETHWPPLDARPHRVHLTPQGGLAAQPGGEGAVAWEEQAERSRAYALNDLPGQVLPLGLVPRVAPLAMPDGVRFEASEPLAAPLRFAGVPEVTLTLASTSPETHLAVRLLSVAPNGTETVWDRGYLSAEHRASVDRVEPLVPGQPATLTIAMYPQDGVIPAGERLALWIGPWDDWARPEGNGARVTLLLGPGRDNHLTLPAVERDLATSGLPVPMWDWRAPG